jgi:hypothetical protein
MRHQPTRPHYRPETRPETHQRGEWPALTARDLYAAARAELAAYFTQQAAGNPQPDPGVWIHLGCGGELVRLQGLDRPVCSRCGKAVR